VDSDREGQMGNPNKNPGNPRIYCYRLIMQVNSKIKLYLGWVGYVKNTLSKFFLDNTRYNTKNS
jgi:hypothetical protein